MGTIVLIVTVSDKKAKLKINAQRPSVCDLSTALAQLELLKINLLGRIAKASKVKMKDIEY